MKGISPVGSDKQADARALEPVCAAEVFIAKRRKLRMRKTWGLVFVLIIALGLAGAAAGEVGGEHRITENRYETYVDSDAETKLNQPTTLYFLDGAEDLPYVDMNEWGELMVYVNREQGEDKDYGLSAHYQGDLMIMERENRYTMTLDFANDTITFDDYDAFVNPSMRATLLDVVSERGVDNEGNPVLMNRIKESCFDRYGDELIIDLQKYGIRMLKTENLYLVPLQTMNDFTLIHSSRHFLFNGENLFLANSGMLYSDADQDLSPLGKLYYRADPKMRSQELTEYSYNELCLALDTFYGLKDTHRIEGFRELFDQIGYEKDLLNPDADVADQALHTFIDEFLNDLHSMFDMPSPMALKRLAQDRGGSAYAEHGKQLDLYRSFRKAAYPEGYLSYEEVGNTAYITFDGYSANYLGAEYYKTREESERQQDTILQIIEAHRQITREGSPIENVVLDMTCNEGGDVDAAMYVLGWMLGEANFSLRNTATGAMSTTVYQVDVNLDHLFDEQDTVKDKKLYCLISPVSFSCGNLVPVMLKASGNVTLIGRTSGGGSCLVQQMTTAYGSLFNISAPYQISFTKNGAYYNVDQGVEPDYYVDRIENLYDRKKLTDYINGLF